MAAVQASSVQQDTLSGVNAKSIDNGTAALQLFEPFAVPGQQDTNNFGLAWSAPFPLALKATKSLTLTESIEAVKRFTESGDLSRLVKHHGGAILIRGLAIETPNDYSKVAHAFGFRPHVEIGRPPLRTVLAPNVKTANEG